MTTNIHPTALISPKAHIGKNCKIGAYSTLADNVTLGDDANIISHVSIGENTTIGKGATIYPFASVGQQSQDLKYRKGNNTYLEIGDNVIIRESVTIHRGTEDKTKTIIGDNCVFLTLSHVGHNCSIGNNVIVSHNAGLAGHVTIDDFANIGAMSGVHQFCYIGKYAMLAGVGKLTQDILPFCIAEGTPTSTNRIVNKIGMQRNGFDNEQISTMRDIFKIVFKQNLEIEQAIDKIKQKYNDKISQIVLDGLAKSHRGLAR